MNTLDLLKILHTYDLFQDTFIGVYPIDKLPKIINGTFSIIINTDPHYKNGQHWLAIIKLEKGKCVYFDSYGKKPTNNLIVNFIDKNCNNNIIYNNQKLQSLYSNVCGYYCIIFLTFIKSGLTLNDFLIIFDKNTNYNDLLIEELFKTIYKN